MITENVHEMIQPRDTGRWTRLSTTKHKGKTLPQVVFDDPDYFFWAYEHKVFRGELSIQAEEVYKKARHIKVPQRGEGKQVVLYLTHHPAGKFATMELVKDPGLPCDGQGFMLDVIDLSVPRQISAYDKVGSKHIISKTKVIFFGDPHYKMTKRRCESFFEDESNFAS
jgi:hypothetical protein